MNKSDTISLALVDTLLYTHEEHYKHHYSGTNFEQALYNVGEFISENEYEIVYFDWEMKTKVHANKKYIIWWAEGDVGDIKNPEGK